MNQDKSEQNEGYTQYRASNNQESVTIPIGKDQLLENIHFELDRKDKVIFTFVTIEKGGSFQMGTKASTSIQ